MKKEKKLKFYEAKKICIVQYLQSRGLNVVKETRSNYWFFSPFRNETKPSFSVRKDKNSFFDFGNGESGDIIDLVRLLEGTDNSGALEIIKQYHYKNPETPFFSFSREIQEEIEKEKNFKFTRIISTNLSGYLWSRGINYQLVNDMPELGQLNQYPNGFDTTPVYYNVAFKNDSGGFELSNVNGFKSCVSPKDITTIKGQNYNLMLFEGFIDYLSALTHFRRYFFNSTVIVLNSLTMLEKVLPGLKQYDQVSLFLDNDNPGMEATKKIIESHPNAINQALKYYPKHKDFNELLVSLMNKKP